MDRTWVDHPYMAVRRELGFPVPFAEFTRALESLLGRMDIDALPRLACQTPERGRAELARMMGLFGFAMLRKIEQSSFLKAVGALESRAATTYVVGSTLLTDEEMTVRDPAVGLYASSCLHVAAREHGGVVVAYDVPSVTLGQFQSASIDTVAALVDVKLVKLVEVAAALAAKACARRSRPHVSVVEGGRR